MAGQVLIKFPVYLAELKMIERTKPKSEQRKVPSAREMAEQTGPIPVNERVLGSTNC